MVKIIHKLSNLDNNTLDEIINTVSESYVNDDWFKSFGSLEERKKYVHIYMDAYIKYAYKHGQLFADDEEKGYIGLSCSNNFNFLPKLLMKMKIKREIPKDKLVEFKHFLKQVENGDKKYKKTPHLEIIFICVPIEYQNEGRTTQLIEYAKEVSDKRGIPCLVSTDMDKLAKMYRHYGLKLYNTKKADNGVTRFNLVY